MDARKRVAWNIRRWRVKRGLPQEALAVDAGVDRTYVSRLERGLENPTVLVLERLSQALDIPLPALFDVPRKGEKPPTVMRRGRKPKNTLSSRKAR